MLQLRYSNSASLTMKALNPVVKDEWLFVPPASEGEFFQILDDTAVLGAPRQIVDGLPDDFDFPAVVNKKWGLVTRHPGFNGVEYESKHLDDSWYWLWYDLLEWASDHRLPRGNIVDYEIGGDGLNYPVVEPIASMLWVWTELVRKGKSHFEAGSAEGGYHDPITGRNPLAPNMNMLMRPFVRALCRRVEQRGAYWGYEVLDVLRPAPRLDYVLKRPWLYMFANASSRRMVGNRYAVSDFPQIAEAFRRIGLPRTGTPFLNLGLGGVVWILKSSCSPILKPGSRWTPYVP